MEWVIYTALTYRGDGLGAMKGRDSNPNRLALVRGSNNGTTSTPSQR